jgi:ubiquitin-conjugating enzyme E2 variant
VEARQGHGRLDEYRGWARAADGTSILLFVGLAVAVACRLGFSPALWVAIPLGWLLADAVSGTVHWAADTWGTVRWPIVGPLFIRPFREHHVDPTAITRHDFVEVNGSNCMVACPVLGSALFIPEAWGPGVGDMLCALDLSLCGWVMATNQFHSWAHRESVPTVVAWLQRSGIALGREHHAGHHGAPYDRRYCITSGVLNSALDRVGAWRFAERVVSGMTGARAREEDGVVVAGGG